MLSSQGDNSYCIGDKRQRGLLQPLKHRLNPLKPPPAKSVVIFRSVRTIAATSVNDAAHLDEDLYENYYLALSDQKYYFSG
ncbi:MAG: hypothetical protein WCF90_02430 [Methanomicrobiales archaeon]